MQQLSSHLSGQELERVEKGHNDFATRADIASEKAILDIIRQERPGDGIVGEESGAHPPLAAESSTRRVLDPPSLAR